MQTVVETPAYLKAAASIFTEAERENIVAMVAADPECGELIQGTGGFRKVRVGRRGMGKRGGARVILHFAKRVISDLSYYRICKEQERQSDKTGTE